MHSILQRRFVQTHLPALAALCLCVGAASAYERTLERPRAEFPDRGDVPRLESAEAQFKRANELRTAARKAKGEEHIAAEKAAAAAFRAVHQYFPESKALAAESAFRAGELLRACDDDAGASSEFSSARELGVHTSFKARAAIEIAHIARRAHELEHALKEFQGVIEDEDAEKRYRDDAALWAARVTAEAGRVEDARARWQKLADGAESPIDRIEAYDDLASSYVDAGELDVAAATIEKCRKALADVVAEETPLGERARSSLARMHSVRRLQREVSAREKGVTLDKSQHK